MPTPPKPGKILIYGLDPVLLDTRKRILERVGLKVQVARGREEFQGHTAITDYDLLIICHTVPETEQRQIALAGSFQCSHILQVPVLVQPETFLRQVQQQTSLSTA